jgi:hypothetical protein
MNKLLLCTAVGAVPVALAAIPPDPFDLERDVACVIPEGALIYVEAPGLPDLCEQGLGHPLIKTVLASPLGELIAEQSGMPPAFALGMLNVWAGRPVLPTLAKLTSEGLAFGVLPAEGAQPIYCVVARGDAAEWQEVVAEAMKRVAEAQDYPLDRVVPPHRKIRGMDVWLLGDYGAFALQDGLFVGATDEAVLRRMIDLGAEEGVSGLAAREAFTTARSRYRSQDAFLWSWLDMQGLEEFTPAGGGLGELRKMPANPGVQLLLGPSIANLAGAREGVIEVRFGGDRIELDLIGLEVPEGPQSALLAPTGAVPPALPLAVDNETARGVVYRDFAALFAHRVDLFPAEAQPGFAEATANLALFFGGQDITDEVLPALDPWIGVVSRPLTFEGRAVPDVPLPGLALLIRAKNPESMGPQLVGAVQSVMAILNLEAAQNQQPVMTVNLELHEGTTITYGRLRNPDEGEGVDLRYNLEPACAMVGDTFVLGTHLELVRDLVGQLTRGELAEPGAGESLQLSGREVAQAIKANEQALVLNAVLNEGKGEDEARKEIRGLAALAGMVEALKFETARPAAHDLRASMTLLLGGGEEN